jgi:hypothetical protein
MPRAVLFARLARLPILPVDIVFYLICATYAIVVALTNEFYGYRVWGNFATCAYGLAAVHSGYLAMHAGQTRPLRWLGSRWFGVGVIGALGMLAPLVVLVIRRLHGVDWSTVPGSWAAQPEVWVIERSAKLLLDNGTPYLDVTALHRPPVVNDYTPYGPVMALFGLPRALFGGTPVGDAFTDARLVFAFVAALCLWLAWRTLDKPGIPIRAAQIAAVFPLTALTFAVAGPDLAIIGMLILGVALAAADRPILAACVVALAGNAKALALIAAPVPLILVLARRGPRAAAMFTSAGILASAVINVPALIVNPTSYVENVIRFPAGLAAVPSPAASPLPGHLIANTGQAGKAIAFGLLAIAAIAIAVWLVLRPPVSGSDALVRAAVGLAAFTVLTTATRWGYLLYPVVLLGAALVFRTAEQRTLDQHGNSRVGRGGAVFDDRARGGRLSGADDRA